MPDNSKVTEREMPSKIYLSPNAITEQTVYLSKGNVVSPVAEFSVSICSTPKFICSSDDVAPRLLITEYDTSYKSSFYKNRMRSEKDSDT